MKNTTNILRSIVADAVQIGCCLLIGCSDKNSAESISSPAEAKKTDEGQQLVVLTWKDYISTDVITRFEEETGIEIIYEVVENTVELKARMQSSPGEFDLVIADDVSLRELGALKLIDPLNRSQLTNLENLDERYLGLDSDPDNTYTVPYVWGSTLIAYRTDLIGDVEPSWASFFDTSHGLKVAMLDEMIDAFACALLAKGYSLNSNDPEQLGEAADLLREFANHGDIMVEEMFTALDALDAGDVAMAMTYSGDAAFYAEENELIEYVIPKEGAALFLDSFAVASDARHSGNAHVFIDYMLRPEIAAQNASELWYASPNREALALLDREFLDDKSVWPDHETKQRCDFHADTTGEREVILSKGMKYVMDAVRRKNSKSAVSSANPVAVGK